MQDMMIGVDLAKSVFQIHGALKSGGVQFRKKLTRSQFQSFMAAHPPALVVFEACGGAHYWARQMQALGHEVRLISPQYVRPFVKRQKNDAADAEAIVIAARQPEMRFVEPKSEDQQAKAVFYRNRQRLVHQRTELVNALRAILYEFGHVFATGFVNIKRISAFVADDSQPLPRDIRRECQDLLAQISEKTQKITERDKAIAKAPNPMAKRLQTMPGLGPLSALVIEAFAPPMEVFKRGRDFAAWLGLVPKQHSSGGKARLGRVSKAGQADIRRLLMLGAMSRLNWLGRKVIPEASWLGRLLAKKPRMLVAIALANKMARQVWAMLAQGQDYKDPAQAPA